MATYTVRGQAHNVVYTYKNEDGQKKQHWESYETELEAMQRKIYIDYLQKNKRYADIQKEAAEYRTKRTAERGKRSLSSNADPGSVQLGALEGNLGKTYAEFVEVWLPVKAKRELFSPNTYDSYLGHLNNHILPYFGDRIMSGITAVDIDNFIMHLARKPRKSKGNGLRSSDALATLSSATIKKCHTIFVSGFADAVKWGYVSSTPESKAPAHKSKKRKAWGAEQIYSFLKEIEEDKLLHLAVHLTFIGSLREGEVTGILVKDVDFYNRCIMIRQEVQRVTDQSLNITAASEILRVFPKKLGHSKSSLILKAPKTDDSIRRFYLTTPLLQEIKERIQEIERNKEILGSEYHDYGLLLCNPDGYPFDPKSLGRAFKNLQNELGYEDQIDFQGIRKTGQMHKVRITKNNYQLVAANAGHSPEVLLKNYDEALDSEKRTLATLIETSFYPTENVPDSRDDIVATILAAMSKDPNISEQILKTLLLRASNDAIGAVSRV